MNKKGNFPDIAEYLNVALVLGLAIIVVFLFVSEWNTSIQGMNETVVPAEAKAGIQNLDNALPPAFDWLFIAILLIFIAFSVAMARLIPSSPKFIIISIFSLLVLPFGAMIVENIWSGFAQQPKITALLLNFNFLPYIMNNLTIVTVFYSLIVMIALLTKNETGDGNL